MSEANITERSESREWRVIPLRRILTEAAEVLSFWPSVRDNDLLAPTEARDLLALWAHLRRFPDDFANEKVDARAKRIRGQLQETVQTDWGRLLDQMLRCRSDAWCALAEEFDQAWDDLLQSPEPLQLDCRAWELFCELDRFSLAAYAANRLLSHARSLPAEDTTRIGQRTTGWELLKKDVEQGEHFLLAHPDVFFPASPMATTYLREYRADLDQVDCDLWLTTLKHSFLEELLREANDAVLPGRLDESALAAVPVIVGKLIEGESTGEARQPRNRSIRRPVLRLLEETMDDITEAFRQHLRAAETMLATAAASGEKKEAKVLWDFKQDLVRCIVYQEVDGHWRFDFSSTDDRHENQTFEIVVKEQTRPTITFRRDPETGELYGEARIHRDELPEAPFSQLTIRLKKT